MASDFSSKLTSENKIPLSFEFRKPPFRNIPTQGQQEQEKDPRILWQLCQDKKISLLPHESLSLLEQLLELPDLEISLREQALLERADLQLTLGQFGKVEEDLSPLVHSSKNLQAQAHDRIGQAAYRQRDLDRALSHYEKGLSLTSEDSAFLWLSIVLESRKAQVLYDQGLVDQAGEIFESCWTLWKSKLSPDDQIKAISNNIDQFYFDQGEFDKALSCLSAYKEILSEKHHCREYALTLYKIARCFGYKAESEKAETYLQECLYLLNKQGVSHWLDHVHNELGFLYQERQEHQRALFHFRQAFDMARQFGVLQEAAIIAKNTGNSYAYQREWDKAEEFYQFAIEHLQPSNARPHRLHAHALFFSLLGLVNVYAQKKNYTQAQEILDQAEMLLSFKAISDCRHLYWSYLAFLRKKQGLNTEAEEALEEMKKVISSQK